MVDFDGWSPPSWLEKACHCAWPLLPEPSSRNYPESEHAHAWSLLANPRDDLDTIWCLETRVGMHESGTYKIKFDIAKVGR